MILILYSKKTITYYSKNERKENVADSVWCLKGLKYLF